MVESKNVTGEVESLIGDGNETEGVVRLIYQSVDPPRVVGNPEARRVMDEHKLKLLPERAFFVT